MFALSVGSAPYFQLWLDATPLLVACLVVLALIGLWDHVNRVAHMRATTTDGPDADYREEE